MVLVTAALYGGEHCKSNPASSARACTIGAHQKGPWGVNENFMVDTSPQTLKWRCHPVLRQGALPRLMRATVLREKSLSPTQKSAESCRPVAKKCLIAFKVRS